MKASSSTRNIRDACLFITWIGAAPVLAQPTGWNNGGGCPERTAFVNVPGPTENVLLWQVNTAGFFGAPVYIEGGRFVTMRFLGLTQAPVECRSMGTGALIWSQEVTGGAGRSLPVGFRDGQVYVMRLTESLVDSLFALDAATGERIWTAATTTCTHITSSVNFAPDGDLFVEAWEPQQTQGRMCRISRTDGSVLWQCPFQPVNIGASELTVHGNTGYLAENINGVANITAINITTGERLYSHPVNDTQQGGGEQYCALVVDTNGTIFYHKLGDNVSAFTDDGSQFTLLWETPIQGYAPFSQMCIGADGSVYAPSNGRVIRLDPATGEVLNTSALIAQNPQLFQMRASAAANDMVFVTDGDDGVHAFTPDLQPVWTDPVPNINTSGVSIAFNGLTVVTGAGIIKAYKPTGGANAVADLGPQAPVVHTDRSGATFRVTLPQAMAGGSFRLCDALGRCIGSGRTASGPIILDLTDRAPGLYLLAIESGPHGATVKLVKE